MAKNYFGLSYVLQIILAIFPTNIVFGIIARIQAKNWLMVLLNIIVFPVFYIIDLVSIIANKKLEWLI